MEHEKAVMKLSNEWEIKLEKLYDLGVRRLARARKCFYKAIDPIQKEWDIRFYRLIERNRLKVSGRNSLWNKKLDSLSSAWNIWCQKINGEKPTIFTSPKKYLVWESRLVYMLSRWNYKKEHFGWTKKLDWLRRNAVDMYKRIKGGRGNVDKKIKNERIGIKDLRRMLEGQNYQCALTGRRLTPENCSLDHIVPLSKGGAHSKENAQLVDAEVNKAKGMLTEEEFIQLCKDVVEWTRRKR